MKFEIEGKEPREPVTTVRLEGTAYGSVRLVCGRGLDETIVFELLPNGRGLLPTHASLPGLKTDGNGRLLVD